MLAIKSSRANLEKCTRLFLLLGLVGALIIASVSIEYKSKNVQSISSGFGNSLMSAEEENIPEAKVEPEIPKSTVPIQPTPILEQIKIVADDRKIKETILSSTETDEREAVVVQKIVITEVKEEKITEEVTEDVPFFIIEDVPKFPGCHGTNDELRKCMQENVQKFVYENFDVKIAEELGLEPGIKRIFVTFVIDKNGEISNVESRAPHKRLQAEAERVINSLPKMEPGKQRGRPVGVKYSLPIVFEIKQSY